MGFELGREWYCHRDLPCMERRMGSGSRDAGVLLQLCRRDSKNWTEAFSIRLNVRDKKQQKAKARGKSNLSLKPEAWGSGGNSFIHSFID